MKPGTNRFANGMVKAMAMHPHKYSGNVESEELDFDSLKFPVRFLCGEFD